MEAPTEPPAEAPAELPAEAPTEPPVEAPTEPPAEVSTQASAAAPTGATTGVLMEAIGRQRSSTGTEAPADAPAETPAEESSDAIVIDVQDECAAQSGDVPAEIPAEVSTEVSADASAEQPADEHVHSDSCYEITYQCGLEEHIHDFSCYSDILEGLESWDIWTASIPELTGRISEDIVLVAQSQLGCAESTLNFELAEDGQTRNGITRYGQWYGNPYGPWSNMFTAFCLRYAGAANVPINSGAEAMRLAWEEAGIYRYAGGYEPVSGDIVFLDKNQNGAPEATAVVVSYFDFILTVIEGDVDNAVVQHEYRIDDPVITGYGITNSVDRLMMFAAGDSDTPITIGTTIAYPKKAGTFILYATIGGKSYAIDRNGDAVPVTIADNNITANVADPTTLYWTFTGNNNSYNIRSVTQPYKYLNPSNDALLSDNSQNLTLSGSSTGAKIRTGNTNSGYYLQLAESGFGSVRGQSDGSIIYFGQVPSEVTLWLDGTNGNIISYRGSENTKYTVYSGIPMQLPSEWKSPTKYQYRLAGWVDISTGQYYKPGDMITVTKDTVLYADWAAATYDIGRYNSHVVDTVSTSDFITTHVFDYSSLINLYSTNVNMTVNANSHSESWSHADSGNAVMGPTMDFSFVEEHYGESGYNDAGHIGATTGRGEQGKSENVYTGGTKVYPGIITGGSDPLVSLLFGKDSTTVGKHYLGEGDHLFQLDTDPRSDTYGYYYYDSRLNAASYNQSDQRFYVYDYLALSSDSPENKEYSDFLPLNSPYANTAGTVSSDVWGSGAGDYAGETYYTYESKYTENNGMTRVDWWLGMRTDISFGLPDDVGSGGNKDLYGDEMHFYFTGDDDVWILIDGEVVLDLGGIHRASEGDINFSTGEVRVNGEVVGNISGKVKAGEHTLSILYLERGASMGNCAMYFNLAPRFSLTLEKEDVLTQEILNGAKFAVFKDEACTEPCYLWPSQKAYKEDPEGNKTNEFTIEKGKAYMWGLSPSETYYLKEIVAPGREGYEIAKGVIKVTLDKNGLNSYGATILPDSDGTITNGFTVHGFQIDDEEQAVYLTITNAQNWIKTTTSVYVEKLWNDNKDHSYDSVTVYLQVTDPDGTVRRIRQIDLSKENDWAYSWSNLPKYRLDPDTGKEYIPNPDTPEKNAEMTYHYSVVEAYESGYQQKIEYLGDGSNSSWSESPVFVNGQSYILYVEGRGYLATSGTGDSKSLTFITDEATAKKSELALWTATVSTVSDNNVKLTNKAGQSIRYNNNNAISSTTGSTNTTLKQEEYGDGVVLSYTVTTGNWWNQTTTTYYLSKTTNGVSTTTTKSSAMVIKPMQKPADFKGYGYRVTNTPLTSETSVKVHKDWATEDKALYEKLKVTVKLFYLGADGKWVDTGRTETLDLKSNWEALFQGLPYQDADGKVYTYRIEEVGNDDWIPVYGEVTKISGTNNWQVTLTNHYRWTDAVELPSTGGIGIPLYILIGLTLVAAPFVYGFSLRREYERRLRE